MRINYLILISWLIFALSIQPASAAEIFGRISTKANDFGGAETPIAGDDTEADNGVKETASAPIFKNKTDGVKAQPSDDYETGIKVLGIEYYPDGTLLRSSDKKVFLIQGKYKKHIRSLKELIKFRGQAIFDVNEDTLSRYAVRQHSPGDLIREIGTPKVYVVENERKRHIVSLEELAKYYFKQIIYNIDSVEMKKY